MIFSTRRFASFCLLSLIMWSFLSVANAKTAEENKATGEAFLAENAKKPGVVTTASGLQYKVITEGTGASPSATSTVSVHYKGTTIQGKEFDSSYKRGAPASFPLNRVIPGWTEGLQLMKEGGKSTLYIPSNLAYGERSVGADIGPNETLIFEVELVKVN
jgi:FKBP-type peptidyl-prolyl cis-trans isomerase FkpA